MRRWIRLLLLASVGLPFFAQGTERNDIPSCYAFAKMEGQRPADAGRELVVVLDQTTPLTADLRDGALKAAMRFIRPGDNVLIYQFSAYMADNYTRLLFEGRMEPPIEGELRNEIGMESLRKLDRCLNEQQRYFAQLFPEKFGQGVGRPDVSIGKSEIMFSLRQIADDLARRPASRRVVLLVSDLLENSDFGSFYARNSLRSIDSAAELAKAQSRHLFADFKGAHVYVHGAGLVPANGKEGYRSGAAIDALRRFWSGYFERSHATLEAFGAPALTVDLR
jgi:hypothetical protein